MHVGILCHNFPPHPGGLEVMVQTLARGLAERSRVTLVTSAWKEPGEVVEEEGVRVHRLPAFHFTESWSIPYPLPKGPGLRRALRELRTADVVNVHGSLYLTSLFGARLARRLGKPLVVTEHVGFVRYKSALVNAVQRAAWASVGRSVLGRAAVATTYNARVVDWLRRRRPSLAVRFIVNGVDIAAFRPRSPAERRAARARLGLPAEETLVLFVGRESEKKNLGAVLTLPREGFRLVVCGAVRDLPPDVVDLGLLPHGSMADLYGAADVMVQASSGEGFPLAVQEALASGLPLALLWDEGYTGSLERSVVASFDDVSELGDVVRSLVADPEKRRRLAAGERAWAEERWSWETTVRTYEELFQEVQGKEVPA